MRIFLFLGLFAFATAANAASRTEKVTWKDKDTQFDGVLVWDDASASPRPGLLMVPNWYGVNDKAIEKARVLAGDDYVILLVDMYGRGVRPANAGEAGKASGAVGADSAVLRSRINTALATFRASGAKAPVDTGRIGAIGFCFGGTVVLELARTGADIAGVASFHGNPMTRQAAAPGEIKAPLLVMNGADDKFVPEATIDAFQAEMRAADADWQFVNFGGAVHCFAEPDEHGEVPGCEFHEPSYRRSVAMMHDFFGEAFGTPAQ